MPFITKSDLEVSIRTNRLDQIVDGDDAIIVSAIAEAESILANYLAGPGYNITSILGAAGDNRDQTLVGWCKYITLYKIFERIPDEAVPERVIKNYDDTMAELRRVADGRYNLNLPHVTGTDGKPKTKFRWGSETPRST
jgi:phage gp36-like protein